MTKRHQPLRFAALLSLCLLGATVAAQGAALIKANNTTALNLSGSYVSGGPPTSADTVTWDSTVTGANSSALGGSLSVLGLVISNPGGAITVADTAGATLSIFGGGIDMSSASQNLTLNPNLAAAASQTWTVNGGRTLNLWAVNTSRGMASSTGHITLAQAGTGTATFVLQPGASGSTGYNDAGGSASYSGNWTFGANTLTRNIRNGATAWGTGILNLSGGTIGGWQGNWAWNNTIKLADGTASYIRDQNTSGTTRYLKLEGAIVNDSLGSGTLTFQAPATSGAFGSVGSQYGYILTGINTFTGGLTIDSGAFVRIGGDAAGVNTANAGNNGSLAATLPIVNNGQLTLTRNNSWTLANNISGSGRLYVGHGSLTTTSQAVTLSGNNTYSGPTTIINGKLIGLTGGSCANSAVTVASGATLGVKLNTAGGTWSCASLTFNSTTTTAEFDFNNKAPSTTTAPLQVSGNVLNSGTLNVTILNGIFAATDYPLITTTGGTLTPGTLGAVTMPGGAVATLTSDSTTIYLHVTTPTPVTYYWGAGTGLWDIGTTANWNNLADGSSTVTYADGQPTIFDDSSAGTAPFTVTLNTTVAPGSLTVNNPTKDYTISGSGSISGSTALTKQGAGKLTLSTANTFTGATIVNGGTLSIGGDANLGAPPVSPTAGSLVLNGGTLAASSGFTLAANRGLALGPASGSGGGTIDVASGQTLAYAGVAANNGGGTGSLTKTGNGTLALSGPNAYTGPTTVSSGTLAVSGGSAIPDGSTVSLASGATFEVNDGETVAGLSTVAGSTVTAQSGTLQFTSGSILGSLTGSGTVLRNGTTDTAFGQFTTADALAFNGTLRLRGSTPSTSPAAMQGGTGRFWLHSASGSQAAGTAFALDTGSSATDAQDFIIGDWDATSGNRRLTLASLSGYGTLRTDAGGAGVRTVIVDQSGGATVFHGMVLSHTSGAGEVRALALEKKGTSSLTLAGIVGKQTAAAGAADAPVSITVSDGTLVLAAANTYTGPTTVNAGNLVVSGSLAAASAVTVNGGTLGGSGTINGPVSVNAGGTLAPGASVGTLTVNNTLTLAGTTAIEVNKAGMTLTSDLITGITTLNCGGTVTVAATGDALAVGDEFTVFNAGSFTGSFSGITPAPGAGLAWDTYKLATQGKLLVHANPVPGAATASVARGGTGSLGVAKLVALASGEPGETLSIVNVSSPTPAGGTATLSGGNLLYTAPTSGPSDTISYTLSDGRGGLATGTVTVMLTSPDAPSLNVVSPPSLVNNEFKVTFAGIPGQTYTVEDSTVSPVGPWNFLTHVTAGSNGLFQLVVTNDPPAAQRYFRTTSP